MQLCGGNTKTLTFETPWRVPEAARSVWLQTLGWEAELEAKAQGPRGSLVAGSFQGLAALSRRWTCFQRAPLAGTLMTDMAWGRRGAGRPRRWARRPWKS